MPEELDRENGDQLIFEHVFVEYRVINCFWKYVEPIFNYIVGGMHFKLIDNF